MTVTRLEVRQPAPGPGRPQRPQRPRQSQRPRKSRPPEQAPEAAGPPVAPARPLSRTARRAAAEDAKLLAAIRMLLSNPSVFPRVFYLKYHMYPIYFPLMAISRYRAAVGRLASKPGPPCRNTRYGRSSPPIAATSRVKTEIVSPSGRP